MKMLRVIAALWLMLIPALGAEQSNYQWPTSPVPGANDLGSLTATYYNPALRALAGSHNGPTAPANGPGGAPLLGQPWFDTSASPSINLRYWDGASWATLATLDASTHAWIIATASTIRNVTGTSDTLLDGDRGKLVDVANPGSVAQTLPQAGSGGAFVAGWYTTVRNSGAGTVTITPTTSLIDGAASVPLRPGQSFDIRSDGTNYKTTLPQQPWNANLTAFSAKTAPSGAVVGTTDSQTLTNKTLSAPAITSPTGIVKGDVGLGNVDNTSDATKNAATATLTNKTLTAPAITSPTGIVKGDVGLGNVDNTSDTTKNAATATLTNKTLTAPVVNSPTGIVKGDVGLANVDNTSDATKNAATATLTNKTINGANNTLTVRLGSDVTGTVQATNFPALSGDVSNSAGSLVTAIGASKVTSAMLNADVYSTARSWSGQQTFTNPLVGTQSPGDNSTKAASTAYADAIAALKANLVSPAFTGTPTAPTASASDNSTKIATTAYVDNQVAGGVAGVASLGGQTGTLLLGTGLTNTGTTIKTDKATGANLRSGAADKVLAADAIFDPEQTITYAASQTFDFSAFLDARLSLTGNVTSLTCSNIKAGQAGTITIVQDATGSRTMVAAWCSQLRWANGARGVLSTAASAIDALHYKCISTSICYASLAKAQAN